VRSRRVLGLGAWCFYLGASLWALEFAGRGDLASPPFTDPGALLAWPEAVGLGPAVGACARLIALVCAWYLLAITLLGALVRVSGFSRAVKSIDLVTPRWLRPLLEGAGVWTAASLTLVGTPLIAASVGPVERAASTASLAVASEKPQRASPTAVHAAQGPVLASPTTIGPAASTPGAPPEQVEGPAPISASDSRAHDKTEPATWTVAPGDHFWRIAAETLAESMAVGPRKRQVAAYWLALIEANRDRLVVADNPDLLYPGQVLVLPPPVGSGDQPGE
jgi:nucleoid-associated protein YgaU